MDFTYLITSVFLLILITYIFQWIFGLLRLLKDYLDNKRDIHLSEDDIANIHWNFMTAILIEFMVVIIAIGLLGIIYYFILY